MEGAARAGAVIRAAEATAAKRSVFIETLSRVVV